MTDRRTSTNPEPKVLVDLYDFAPWLMQRNNRMPKNWRVTLGDSIDRQLLEMLAQGQLARMRRDKGMLLDGLSEQLEILRIQIRLSHDLGGLNTRQYGHASERLEEIGRQLGGWIKQQRKKPEQ